ncbi:MAG: IS630 family transposase [Planctomycetaceae bacterium]|jgi:transposase|nr:IS630 family transposase [Planctomycetaceae bacterium]
MNYHLSRRQVKKLRQKYRKIEGQRFADRIRIVIALAEGFTPSELAKIFLIDADTVRRYFRLYKEGGINGLLEIHYAGRRSFLTDPQKEQLKQHLRDNIYLDVKPIIAYVRQTFGVQYSVSGMTKLLHELNFEYKKPKLVPGKANTAAQEEWVAEYEKLREQAKESDVFYFMDGVHPQHNSHPACGWFERGEDAELPSNSGRQRVNINGAVNIDTFNVTVDFTDAVNSESVIRLMEQLIKNNPKAKKIYIILDNASYYHSKEVEAYRKKLGKIIFLFLPPYSPNLNLIERLWKFFKEKTFYNKYYEKFADFKKACEDFFKNIKKYKAPLRKRLAENFHINKK